MCVGSPTRVYQAREDEQGLDAASIRRIIARQCPCATLTLDVLALLLEGHSLQTPHKTSHAIDSHATHTHADTVSRT